MAAGGGAVSGCGLRRAFSCCVLIFALAGLAPAEEPTKPPQPVPVVDGGAGPCWVEFTVRNSAGKPVYAASIRVHIEYGFMDLHKLDLEVKTNAEGKGRFEGLPDDTPLFFRASKGKLKGVASYNPKQNCRARHSIFLVKRRR